MKPTIKRGLGALTPQTWGEIYAVVGGNGVSSESERPTRTLGGDRSYFTAKITGATQITGIARWKYEFEQVQFDLSANPPTAYTVPNGLTSATVNAEERKAWNTLETANTSTSAYGIAVTSGINIASTQGFTIRAIPTGALVEMAIVRAKDGKLVYQFSAPNPIDGTCQAAPSPIMVTDFGSFDEPIGTLAFGTFALPTGAVDFTTFV